MAHDPSQEPGTPAPDADHGQTPDPNHGQTPDANDDSASRSGPHDGRDREPGTHPAVERSGRSRTTAITLVALLALAGVMYLAIWLGIITPG